MNNFSKKQQELIEKHGTPETFENAIWRACDDMWITDEEASKAIKDYKREFSLAGNVKKN